MKNRSVALRNAVSVLTDGGIVEVFGRHGVGKTHFASTVIEHFRNLLWHVIEVPGIYAFRNSPFGALGLAGLVEQTPRPSLLGEVMTELTARLSTEHTLLVIEDAENVDEASWGALTTAAARHDVPVLLTRTPGASEHGERTRFERPGGNPGFGIRLGPLGFDDLSAVLANVAGSPLPTSALSHVFSSSGGNPGLAIALTQAALLEGRLESGSQGWGAANTWWSDALVPRVDAYLAEITGPQREALELISLIGVVDVDTLVELVGNSIPSELEELGLVEYYPSADQLLAAVTPPLIVDYFRHRPSLARRHRISRQLEAAFTDSTVRLPTFRLGELTQTPDAPFVRLVHEHLRSRLQVAKIEWERRPSHTTLANLIEVAVASGATVEELDALFSDAATLQPEHNPEVVLRWRLLQVDHWLFTTHEYDRALAELAAQPIRPGTLDELLNIRRFEIERALNPTAERALVPVPDDPDLPDRVRVAAHMALGSELLRLGRTTQARSHYELAVSLQGRHLPVEQAGFIIVTDYFGGRPDRARESVQHGLAAARDAFDNIEIRGYCYLAALIDLLDGRLVHAESAIRLAFSLGEPVRQPPFVHLSLLVLNAVGALERGDLDTARRMQELFEQLPAPDSPLPGGSRVWASARLTAALGGDGQSGDGATQAEEAGDATWEHGNRLNAALMYLISLELELTAERFERVEARLREMESPYIAVRLEVYLGRLARDHTSLTEMADSLWGAGFFTHALDTYRDALAVATERGSASEAERIRSEITRLIASLPAGVYRTAARRSPGQTFTAREIEIARRAISGLSNQAIADELVLSVRTVESHMHRLMKKANVEKRRDLGSVDALRSFSYPE